MEALQHIELWDVSQVAAFLKLHEITVRKMIRDGRLEAVKVGKGYRVKSSTIEKYLSNQTVQVGR